MAEKKYTWPNWMPKAQADSYGIHPVDRRRKTDMEMGGIMRVEFDTDESQCSVSFTLSQEESAWFDAFEKSVLSQGALWFDMPLWVSGKIENHTVRFAERPKLTGLIGFHSVYTATLEVKERKTMPKVFVLWLMLYSPSEIRRMSDRLHEVLHIEAPRVTNMPDYWI